MIAKAYLFTDGKTFVCNTGCATCTLIYTDCASCSTNYEILGTVCIPFPTTTSCTFLNDYKGFYDSHLLCQYQYPVTLPMNSKIQLNASNNWDLSGTTPALMSSSTSMAYTGVSIITDGSFTQKIDMALTSVVSSGTTLQYQIKLRNPTSTTVGTTDWVTLIYDDSDTLIAKSYDFDNKAMNCDLGCSSCNTIYTSCLGCDSGFEYDSSNTSCIQLANNVSCVFTSNFKGLENSRLTCTFQFGQAFDSDSKMQVKFSSNWDFSTYIPSLVSSTATLAQTQFSSNIFYFDVNSDITANQQVQMVFNVKNPISSSISESDFGIYIYDSGDVLKAKTEPFSNYAIPCNTGCDTCGTYYDNCTTCGSGYELEGGDCPAQPTSLSCQLSDLRKGSTDSALACEFQFPNEIPVGSFIHLKFSNNWDLSTVIPVYVSSEPAMSMGNVIDVR